MEVSSSQEHSYDHVPVMTIEVIDCLNLQPDGVYLDGTIGAGGHATKILAQLSSKGKLIGLDRDAEALEICKNRFGASAQPIFTYKSSYHNFPKIFEFVVFSEIFSFYEHNNDFPFGF